MKNASINIYRNFLQFCLKSSSSEVQSEMFCQTDQFSFDSLTLTTSDRLFGPSFINCSLVQSGKLQFLTKETFVKLHSYSLESNKSLKGTLLQMPQVSANLLAIPRHPYKMNYGICPKPTNPDCMLFINFNMSTFLHS